jgi:hypothetical protein
MTAPLPRAQVLALRRERLLARSAVLREHLAADGQVLVAPLAAADQVHAGLRWLRAHPEWPLAAGVLLVALRPGRALRLASRAWWAWRLYRRGRRLLAVLPALWPAAAPRRATRPAAAPETGAENAQNARF